MRSSVSSSVSSQAPLHASNVSAICLPLAANAVATPGSDMPHSEGVLLRVSEATVAGSGSGGAAAACGKPTPTAATEPATVARNARRLIMRER